MMRCDPRVIAFAVCGVMLGATVPGCQNQPAWGLGRQSRPVTTAPAPNKNPPPANIAAAAPRSASDGVIVVQLHFDVMRAELPIESVRQSTKVWNHVDELQIDPRQCAQLARNGLRIGVADADDWPAIQTILQVNQARCTRLQQAVQSGYPLTLDVGEVQDGETIFSYDAQGRLEGATFGPGRKYLHIDYVVAADETRRVSLKVTPEVHVETPDRRWTSVDGEIQEQPQYEGRVYSELAVTMHLLPGQFLVIGPGPQADVAHLLGSKFLEQRSGGVRSETLYLATPQLFRSETAEP